MKNFKELMRRLTPDRRFFSFQSFDGLTQIEILWILFSCPAFVELFARLDRLGKATKPLGYPLSTAVRWLIAQTLTREEAYSRFWERMRCDQGLALLVSGGGELPTPAWLSDAIHDHMQSLQTALASFYRELVRVLIVSDPDLKYGLVVDGMNVHGYSNPSRPITKRHPETGRRVATGERTPATDETAWWFAKREHLASKRPKPTSAKTSKGNKGKGRQGQKGKGGETIRYGWGHQFSAIGFIKKTVVPIFDLYAPRKKWDERTVAMSLLDQLYDEFPELIIPDGEFGIFVADAGYDAGYVHGLLRSKRLEGVIPVGKDPTRKLTGSPIINSHEVNLTYRGDYTPLCKQGPLQVLPSEMGRHPAQIHACPMVRPGVCETPCALQVAYDDKGRVGYPLVKLRVGSLKRGEEIRQRPLFPRRGEQHEQLLALRSGIERFFSLLRSTFRWGCDGDARLPIRGVENMRLRLLVALITLTALALLDDGLKLDESVAAVWGLPGVGVPLPEAA